MAHAEEEALPSLEERKKTLEAAFATKLKQSPSPQLKQDDPSSPKSARTVKEYSSNTGSIRAKKQQSPEADKTRAPTLRSLFQKHRRSSSKSSNSLPDPVAECTAEPISAVTLAKVEAAKQFLSMYWLGLFEYLETRKQRLMEEVKKTRKENLPLIDVLKRKHELLLKETQYLREKRTRALVHDSFQTLARIGRGGYGNVFLVRHKPTGRTYALKRITKARVKDKNEMARILTEREVLAAAEQHSIWLIQLHFSFQDTENLYLVMDYMPGGDFRTLITHIGCFTEEEARFYAAEMILAVDSIHKLGYIHRDLKPDNFLIDREGHVKLADFGLSKKGLAKWFRMTLDLRASISFNNSPSPSPSLSSSPSPSLSFSPSPLTNSPINMTERAAKRLTLTDLTIMKQARAKNPKLAHSVVGSPDYMAYELLNGEGYGFEADWWSIGVILFELVTGLPPFIAETAQEVFENIHTFEPTLKRMKDTLAEEGDSLSPALWDLLQKLICVPEKRLGHRGGDEILKHPFFTGLDIDNIRKEKPPFVPSLQSEIDVSYFAADDTDTNAVQPFGLFSSNDNVQGFTFKRSPAKH